MKLEVIGSASSAVEALADLFLWADQVELAYAWASTSEGKAKHWRKIDLAKVRRAVIGTQFAQTEPWVLRKLDETVGRLKVIISSEGTFHPKLAIARRGKKVRVLMGSSNLTGAGFSTNTELNVLAEGLESDTDISAFLHFFEVTWSTASVMDPGWLAQYEVAYQRRPRPAGLVPQAGLEPQSLDSLDVEWDQYVGLILKQENRRISDTYRISVFGKDNSYLSEFTSTRQAFASYPRFRDMPVDDRRRTIGMGESSGLLGTMRAAGDARKVVLSFPAKVGEYLDSLPVSGEVTLGSATTIMEGLTSIRGISVGVASRLFVAKRPDLFISVNNGSRPALTKIMGKSITTVPHYIQALRRIWSLPWFQSPRPADGKPQIIWDHRVAILDSALYEEV